MLSGARRAIDPSGSMTAVAGGKSSALAILKSRDAEIRFFAVSYFWICWKDTPILVASIAYDTSRITRPARSWAAICLSKANSSSVRRMPILS